ncbi:MAG: ribonuclease R [Deltaproteobacteria bacterium]|nr:ribonuclease R [Deltaproteobacteria bacterium]MBN2671528.1 ribonuclease R [Deltaproteobacteria bacterium]
MSNTNKYQEEILSFLIHKESNGQIKPRKLARQMGISNEDYGDFRAAFKKLRAEGRLLLGSKKALTFPNGERQVLGRFSSNPRGFGFVVPEDKTQHFDLFVPEGKTAGAQDGDLVIAELSKTDEKDGETRYAGRVIEIRERGTSMVVGTLEQANNTWFVTPDGRRYSKPVVIRDVPIEYRKPGIKVKVDIIWYPSEGGFPEGVIMDAFGTAGEPSAEIASVMAAYGMKKEFSKAAIADAEKSFEKFNPDDAPDREDLTDEIIVTIDPDTARDYDDAISIVALDGGGYRLGVHIADVAHFVETGSALDDEAKKRGFSVYFPRFVVPMLPAMLSNGLCSLQEGVKRFARTAFIDYNAQGERISKRVCKAVICSKKRLTYKEAQSIIDKSVDGYDDAVVTLLDRMDTLAKKIEARRKQAGMIHLNLPEIELDLDEHGRVQDAHKADESYTHKIIEMFMVEANEAVAEILDEQRIPFLRRIHPKPDEESKMQLSKFVGACGYDLSPDPSLGDLVRLIEQVNGKDESYAVNLAVLRSFQRATYSIEREGHFALASKFYCHFTSPIRRYPDLMVHRLIETLLRKEPFDTSAAYETEQREAAAIFTTIERSAQAAETELRLVLVLEFLKTQKGELFQGVVTGVTDFGLFVQHPKFLIEGLIRLQDLGDDWWEVSSEEGKVRGEYTGKVFKIGTSIEVRIDGVDTARRQLMLSPSWMPKKFVKEDGLSELFYHNGARNADQAPEVRKPPRKGASMLRRSDRHGRRGGSQPTGRTFRGKSRSKNKKR